MTRFFTGFLVLVVLCVSYVEKLHADLNVYQETTWTAAIRAGVAPAIFNKDGRFTATAVGPGVTLPIDLTGDVTTGNQHQRSKTFVFNDLYNLPFAAGGDLGYFVCDNWEFFLNFEFMHACNKHLTLIAKGDSNDPNNALDNDYTYNWSPRDVSTYALYFGTRYYLCRWPVDCLMPFVGVKLGAVGANNCSGGEKVKLTIDDGRTFLRERETDKSCASFTAGLQLGFDWVFDDNFALTFMSEVIGAFGDTFKSGRQLHGATLQGEAYTNVSANPKALISFPITLGFRVRI